MDEAVKNEVQVVTLRSDALAKKEKWIAKRETLLEKSKSIVAVSNDSDLQKSGKLQTSMSKHIKELAKERLNVTRPIDAIKKSIVQAEKEMVADLQSEQTRIKNINDAYATEQDRLNRIKLEEERVKAAEAAAAELKRQQELEKQMMAQADNPFGESAQFAPPAEDVPVPEPVAPPVLQTPVGLDTSRRVKRWTYVIDDESRVPREYCTPDPKKVRAYMDLQIKLGNDPEMAGVTFTSRISVESR